MIKRTTKRAGGTPRRGQVVEKTWLKTFFKVRRATLNHAHDPATRAAWRESTYRVDTFEYLYRTRQFKLASPLRVHVAHFDIDLR
jgi:hypothetical protein